MVKNIGLIGSKDGTHDLKKSPWKIIYNKETMAKNIFIIIISLIFDIYMFSLIKDDLKNKIINLKDIKITSENKGNYQNFFSFIMFCCLTIFLIFRWILGW